jgi:hypothetical protein
MEEYLGSGKRVLPPSQGGTPIQSILLRRLTKTKSTTAKPGDLGGKEAKEREGNTTGNN